MKILAIEFSSAHRSVALVERGRDRAISEVVETGVRSPDLLGMIDAALKQARVDPPGVEAIALGLGPGSYTGIRAAIAMARGWQLGRGVKLAGVSSAQCVAAEARSEGIYGRVAVVIDAQRGEFYLEIYDVSRESRPVVAPLRLASRADVEAAAAAGATLAGPEINRWFSSGRVLYPGAGTLGNLALAGGAAENLEPIYLRETTFVKAPPPRIIPS
jgi:tRNA threonylcarbamoyladenosine biosynthesis protein TsaB